MLRVVISPAAARDIESILAWSEKQFGRAARKRYESLLERGITDIAKDPNRVGSHARDEIDDNVRIFHLAFSQRRSSQRVKRPRHLLLFRVNTNGVIEIGRVLHESMDLDRHVPEEFHN